MSTTDTKIRRYSELIRLESFLDRFNYLKLDGYIGEETFGFDRYLNQVFYKSNEWKQIRNNVILRDMGCDLGCLDREIQGRIIVHHMNPISPNEILDRVDDILNEDFLITTSLRTHNAIHYSDESLLDLGPIVRKPNDMCPWIH